MRLLILIDSHTIALHESNLNAAGLVQAVHTANPCLHLPPRREGWQAIELSDLVIAIPAAAKEPLELPELSPRQQEVLAGLLQGLTTRQIAERMHLSLGAVRKHIHQAQERLGVKSREEAIIKALTPSSRSHNEDCQNDT